MCSTFFCVFSLGKKLKIFLILQDQIADSLQLLKSLYTYGRHLNCSYISLTQQLFMDKPEFRTISGNTNAFVIFPTRRNANAARILFRQMYDPISVKKLCALYDSLMLKPFVHLVLDYSTRTCEAVRIRSHIFEEFPRIYSLE